jgi:hypothetical protein
MAHEASIKVGLHPGMFSCERFATFELDGRELGLLIDASNLDLTAGLMRVIVVAQQDERTMIGLCNGEGIFCGPTEKISARRLVIPSSLLHPPIGDVRER